MRSVFVTFISLFASFMAGCQPAGDGGKTMQTLADRYNQEDYKGLYALLSPDFQRQASEEDITDFYKQNLRPMGNIQSWKKQPKKDNANVYTVQFAHGSLNLTLYTNGKNEIAGMQWLPAVRQATTTKRDAGTIHTNNPKQTALELAVDSAVMAHLQMVANGGISIALIDGDKTRLFFYGGGEKNGSNAQPDEHTIYEIGSVTKTFTATVLAHAINEGKINADDDIRKYLPGSYPNLEYQGEPITIKQLANHTSGLPRVPDNLDTQPGFDERDPYKTYTEKTINDYLHTITLKAKPGIKSDYSNYGVAILGEILTHVYKEPLELLIKKYVTVPAKMNNTSFSLSEGDMAKMAIGFSDKDEPTPYWHLGAFEAAGGLKSDVTDMAAYVRANMNGINADFRLAHQQTFGDKNSGVALNWMLQTTTDGMHLVWHNGGTFGFSSFCGYLVEKKMGIVVLSNSEANVDAVAISILKELKELKKQ